MTGVNRRVSCRFVDDFFIFLNTTFSSATLNKPAGFCCFETSRRRNIVSTETLPPFSTPNNSATLFTNLKTHHKGVYGERGDVGAGFWELSKEKGGRVIQHFRCILQPL